MAELLDAPRDAGFGAEEGCLAAVNARRAPVAARRRHSDFARAGRRVATILAFAVLPATLVVAILGASFADKAFLYDFNGGVYQAGHAIVRGDNPYKAGFVERQADLKRAGKPARTVFSVPVYPPPVLEAAAPFSLLPYRVAGVLFSLLSIGGLVAGLHLLGVRDWRCFGVAFASWPVLHGLMLGALTPLLVLGAGLAWRHRNGLTAPALSVAAVVTAKLFPWPLGFWLVATRRLRAAALAAGLAIVGTLAAWAIIGFDGMTGYPHMLANLSFVNEAVGVSPVAGLLAVGVSAGVAHVVALLLAAALLAAAWRLRNRPDGDRRALGVAVMAALCASPNVWPHYFALALIPIALMSPRLSPLWLIPLLAYLAPVAQSTGHPWTILPYLAISALLIVRLCTASGRGAAARSVEPTTPHV